jgi:hypothetical protein
VSTRGPSTIGADTCIVNGAVTVSSSGLLSSAGDNGTCGWLTGLVLGGGGAKDAEPNRDGAATWFFRALLTLSELLSLLKNFERMEPAIPTKRPIAQKTR